MKRSGRLERRLVVVLFIMVLVTFYFAQADTNKMESMYLQNVPPVTTSLEKIHKIKPPIPEQQPMVVVR